MSSWILDRNVSCENLTDLDFLTPKSQSFNLWARLGISVKFEDILLDFHKNGTDGHKTVQSYWAVHEDFRLQSVLTTPTLEDSCRPMCWQTDDSHQQRWWCWRLPGDGRTPEPPHLSWCPTDGEINRQRCRENSKQNKVALFLAFACLFTLLKHSITTQLQIFTFVLYYLQN